MSRFGRSGGYLTVGRVVNVEDDPTQSGQVRVIWETGAASQDTLDEKDVPWTRTMFPTTNPSLEQTGGPHTGLRKGSKVYGVPLGDDGQEFMIIGSVPSSGKGEADGKPELDSDIPQAAKDGEARDGESQPRKGDVNAVVTKDKSITLFGEEEGGEEKKAARYAKIDEPIGTLDRAIGGD